MIPAQRLTGHRRRLWFPDRPTEPRPVRVLMPHHNVRPDGGTVLTYEPQELDVDEPVVRVRPSGSRPWETLFLQLLRHHGQKWAPASGDGILVLASALPSIQP